MVCLHFGFVFVLVFGFWLSASTATENYFNFASLWPIRNPPPKPPISRAMFIVGLTGGIACGKSTVSSILKEKHGVEIIDADVIAREVVQPGEYAYDQIISHFGPLIPNLINDDDKSLNRAALGSFVFGDKSQLKVLNGITHPAVRRRILYKLAQNYFKPVVILDVPLLFESGLDRLCNFVITVGCAQETQLQRLLERNPQLSEEEAHQRINSQLSMEERTRRADHTLDNSGSLDSLKSQVESVIDELTPNWFSYFIAIFPPTWLSMAIYNYWVRTRLSSLSKTCKPKQS